MKTILKIITLLSLAFSANAQFGIHLDLAKPVGFANDGIKIGANFEYLFAANNALAIGPALDITMWTGIPGQPSGYRITDLATQAVMKYFVNGDIEEGGFYPQFNLGLNTYKESYQGFSASASNLIYGLGAGYKSSGGFDINVRYNITSVSAYGFTINNNTLQLQLGGYF